MYIVHSYDFNRIMESAEFVTIAMLSFLSCSAKNMCLAHVVLLLFLLYFCLLTIILCNFLLVIQNFLHFEIYSDLIQEKKINETQ